MNLPEAERFFGNRLQVDDHGNGQRLVILWHESWGWERFC
jgi:hypothetical protein